MTQLAAAMQALPAAIGLSFRESYFADTGPFARSHYPKHMEAFAATAQYKRCTVFGANRVGKSLAWCFAMACFLTGKYPDWWVGRRFLKPIVAWAAGVTATQVRDSLQRYLFGTRQDPTMGFVHPEDVVSVSWGKDDCMERAIVRSATGGLSQIEFKTYAMEQERFQSATLDVALMDEEPKAGIYTEAVTRTATTGGLVLTGFTALKGVTPLIAHLMPEFAGGIAKDASESNHWYIFIGWDDVPEAQFSAKDRRETLASYLPHEIDARTKGIPRIGSGKVWPIDAAEIVIPSFEIPEHWPALNAIDPGYQDPTGVLFGRYDMDNDAVYVTGEYRKNLQHMGVHVEAIEARGSWVPCVIDPAGANQTDGQRVWDAYSQMLSNPCAKAEKSLSKGLSAVYDRMLDGRFYVFDTCTHWREEFATYSRDDHGRIIERTEKHHYDLMACTRYLVLGIAHAKQKPHGWISKKDQMRAYVPGAPQQTFSLTDAVF